MSAKWDRHYDEEAARIVKEFKTTGKADGQPPSHWDQGKCDEAIDDIAGILAIHEGHVMMPLHMIRERMTKLYNDLADFEATRVADKLQDCPEHGR